MTGLSRDEQKLALAREFGADHTINVESEDVVERVREITDGAMADVVLELTPIADQPIRDAIECVRHSGRIVLAGLKGGKSVELVTDRLINKGVTRPGRVRRQRRRVHRGDPDHRVRAVPAREDGLGDVRAGRHRGGDPGARRRGRDPHVRLPGGGAAIATWPPSPRAERRQPMLVDMHAHVIPGALDAVGASEDHRGPRIGPCDDDEHARLLENDRGMQFKAIDAFYSAERRLEEQERSGVDAEVVSPMPPLLDYALSGPEGLELSRRVNEFIASLCDGRPGAADGMGMVPMQAPELATAELARVRDMGLVAVEIASNVLGRSLHGDEYEEFWAEAERLEMPVFIHAMPADFGERLPPGLIPVAAFAVGADCAAGVRGDHHQRRRRDAIRGCASPSATAPAGSR